MVQHTVGSTTRQIAARCLLLLISGLLFLAAARMFGLASAEMDRGSINHAMFWIKRDNWGKPTQHLDTELANVTRAAQELSQRYANTGWMNELYADVLALSLAYPSVGPVGADRLLAIDQAFRQAIEIKPRDPRLAARYANFLAQPGLFDTGALDHQLSRAAALGPWDYNTLREVIGVGIARWPVLSCATRRAVLAALERAETFDDNILARWNTDLGQGKLGKLIGDLEKTYNFDPVWARQVVQRCG